MQAVLQVEYVNAQGVARRKSQVLVLFITARDAVEDRVKELELGADDYLVKPFSYAELLARVRTLLRLAAMRAASCLLHRADVVGL